MASSGYCLPPLKCLKVVIRGIYLSGVGKECQPSVLAQFMVCPAPVLATGTPQIDSLGRAPLLLSLWILTQE